MSNENQEIVELIKKSGYSVRKIAKALGIPEQRIYGWTTKGAKPTFNRTIEELKSVETAGATKPK